ncbi:MAG: hypothetical protein U0610_30765 [bacterium]
MFESISDHAQREGFRCSERSIACIAVRQHARKVANLGDPAPVLFSLDFDPEFHAIEPTTRSRYPAATIAVRTPSISSSYARVSKI